MRSAMRNIAAVLLSVFSAVRAQAQSAELHGQASGWLMAHPADPASAQSGLRYIPDLLAAAPLSGSLNADLELSLNAFTDAAVAADRHPATASDVKAYRAWLRLATDRFEARIGLQKINFGSALLFRPLMWFDRVDPRDPLQLTDGVTGLLLRYTFQDNANIWTWMLYGNAGTKGWELSPTRQRTVEYGGRIQSTIGPGEAAITYHHRRADLRNLGLMFAGRSDVPEDRIGLDGKWDLGIGVWFETALTRTDIDIPELRYQRLATLGADYTFGIGDGLYVAAEYFRADRPSGPLAHAARTDFSGLLMTYPLSILDQLSAMIYRDWTNRHWYRIATWQRNYDNWSVYLLGFWNPDAAPGPQAQTVNAAFAGAGAQLTLVFNH